MSKDIIHELNNRINELVSEERSLQNILKNNYSLINDIYKLRDGINKIVKVNPELNAMEVTVEIEDGFTTDDLEDILNQLELERELLVYRCDILELVNYINSVIKSHPSLNLPLVKAKLENKMSKNKLKSMYKDLLDQKAILKLKIDILTLENSICDLESKVDDINYYQNLIENRTDSDKDYMEKFIRKNYSLVYFNENQYKKLERSLKKYNMLAYKKLTFEYYPALKSGEFKGRLISKHDDGNVVYYELDLPTDKLFAQVYGNFILKYHVVKDEYTVILDTIEPTDLLFNGLTSELTTYKGVMISKENATKDMFKIDLLSMLDKK